MKSYNRQLLVEFFFYSICFAGMFVVPSLLMMTNRFIRMWIFLEIILFVMLVVVRWQTSVRHRR
jgi:hypothetical protein